MPNRRRPRERWCIIDVHVNGLARMQSCASDDETMIINEQLRSRRRDAGSWRTRAVCFTLKLFKMLDLWTASFYLLQSMLVCLLTANAKDIVLI